jgi:hypothetical protein
MTPVSATYIAGVIDSLNPQREIAKTCKAIPPPIQGRVLIGASYLFVRLFQLFLFVCLGASKSEN